MKIKFKGILKKSEMKFEILSNLQGLDQSLKQYSYKYPDQNKELQP